MTSDLPIGMVSHGDPNELAKEKQRQDKARGIVATRDILGPPFMCPECGVSFTDKRPLGQHRSQVHDYKSPSAIYSHELYLRQKAKRAAEGISAKSNKEIKAEREARRALKAPQEAVNGTSTGEDQLAGHLAFAAGYVTCFIETYAKGNRLSGNEFARRLAEFLYAKSR